jgi:hypothetical protein
MGSADSEIQTRERHFLPVNRAEHFTNRLAPNVPPLTILQVPPLVSNLPVWRQALLFVQVSVGIGMTLLAGRYRSRLTISFQAIRASLFANAMAPSFSGLRAMMSFSQGQERVSVGAYPRSQPSRQPLKRFATNLPAPQLTP